MQTRKEQKEQRHKDILQAALDLFIRKGYSATKIKDIANAVNMSVGLLFHYFESKERLYTELIKLGVTEPNKMLIEINDSEPIAFFEACAEQTLNYANNSLFTAKMFILMSDAFHNEGIPDEAKRLASSINFYEDTRPIIEKGQQDGTIRPGDPLSLATTFWTALQGVIQVHALNERVPLPKPEWIVDILRAKTENLS